MKEGLISPSKQHVISESYRKNDIQAEQEL
jgi:hypothetical protein